MARYFLVDLLDAQLQPLQSLVFYWKRNDHCYVSIVIYLSVLSYILDSTVPKIYLVFLMLISIYAVFVLLWLIFQF
ncbi:unnamed protein product [Meloidogyne enterolobii]|uniref:Uncharacterized protein n=1 Tax=Meloidogyne enterolobii TaxID=390850 RepID=A0ACB0YYV4_MELEN